MQRPAVNFSSILAYSAMCLGVLPGLAYAKVYLAHLLWQIGHDWTGWAGVTRSSIQGSCYDFAVFWAAGTALRHHIAIDLYDRIQFSNWGRMLFHSPLPPLLYPPAILPLFIVFSWLPLPTSYDVFNLASLTISFFLLWRCDIPRWCIAAGMIGPAVVFNLCLGQFGLLGGALLIFGLCRVSSQPWLGGLSLSLLALKPQYAVLAPVAALASRNWTAIIAGLLGVVIFTSSSLFIFHGALWWDFLHQGRRTLQGVLTVPFDYASGRDNYAYGGASVFWMLRSLHVSTNIAYLVQGVVSLSALVTAWNVWRDTRLPHLNRVLLTVLLTMFVTPYGYINDLCAASILLLTLARRHTPWRNAALAWLWSAPLFVDFITRRMHFLITPVLLTCALALAWRYRYEPPLQPKRISLSPPHQKQPLLAE